MPYIKVNTDKIKTYTTELESSRIAINRIKQEFSDIRYALDWDVRSSSTIDRRIGQAVDNLNVEANSLTKMKNYLLSATGIYDSNEQINADNQKDIVENLVDGSKFVLGGLGHVISAVDFVSELLKKGEDAKKITYTFKNWKMFLKGYDKASGLTSRYNFSTWIKKGATDIKFNALDKLSLGIDIASNAIDMGSNLYQTWTDENKSTEKKVCDTLANVYCTGANIAITVGGKIVGKAAAGAVSAACCAIPVVGPVIGVVAGAATGIVVDKAIGIIADTMTSEAVVTQVSNSMESVVGTAKAGVKAVSDVAKQIAEADTVGEKALKTAELVGTAVVETAKVAVTTAVEGIKTGVTIVAETAKNVGKAVASLFKGW